MQLAPVAEIRRSSRKVVADSWLERDRRDRIVVALGSVRHIPKVAEEALSRYYEYLMEHLCFPFIAHFPEPATSQEEAEFRYIVLTLLDPSKHLGDGFDGIFSKASKGRCEITFPLIDLYLPEDCFSFQLIDDYWYWFWNWQ